MKIKLVIIALMISILTFSFTSVSAYHSKNTSLTDIATDLTYEIQVNNKDLSVKYGSQIIGKTTIHNISGVSLYNNTLYIYYADNLNNNLIIYLFDLSSSNIDLLTVPSNADNNEYCFAADSERIYFVSDNNTRQLCVYENGFTKKYDLESQIEQLLLIDKGVVAAICADGTYIYNQSTITKSGTPLSSYAKYIRDGIIIDSEGNEFYIENGLIKKVTPETTCIVTEVVKPDITAELENGFYKAQAGVTVSKIKKAFANLEITKFTKADGTEITSGKLGTGATFTLSSGEVIEVIVCGEVTGEGNINSRDLKALLNHLSGKELFKGSQLVAADIDEDGWVTTKDALLIAKMY